MKRSLVLFFILVGCGSGGDEKTTQCNQMITVYMTPAQYEEQVAKSGEASVNLTSSEKTASGDLILTVEMCKDEETTTSTNNLNYEKK
jgi:hypothetical protein